MVAVALVGAVLVLVLVLAAAAAGRNFTASARHHMTSPSKEPLPFFFFSIEDTKTVWQGGPH